MFFFFFSLVMLAQELRDTIKSKPIRILDVRPKTEFEICHLPSSIRMAIFSFESWCAGRFTLSHVPIP
jgi:rhodanese-related sulfurtransferase